MKLLNNWIPDNLLQAFGWTLVHSLWQLVFLAGLLWVVLKITHQAKPSVKYRISVGALLLSMGMVMGTFYYELNDPQKHQPLSSAEIQSILGNYPTVQLEANSESILTKASKWIEPGIPDLVNFWFLGSILFLLRLFGNLHELRNLRRYSSPVSDFQLEKIAYRLAGKMGITSKIQLRVTESGLSPLTFGMLRPVVLLPAALVFQLSPAQLEAILAHELAHVKRNDYLVNLLLSGLEVIFFFHPCYWWMSHTVKELREHAADDLAIQAGIEPKHLATGLAEVLNFTRQNHPQLAQAAGKKRNPTLQRIKRMLGYKTENYPQTPIISIPMLLTLVLSLGLMASAQQDAPKPLLKTPRSEGISPSFAPADTVVKQPLLREEKQEVFRSKKDEWIFSDGTTTYRISGDTLFSEDDFVILSEKTKRAMEELNRGEFAAVPEFDFPDAPEFFSEMSMPEFPEIEIEYPMMESPEFPDFPMEAFLPMPVMEPLEFPVGANGPFQYFYTDTVKAEREKWSKEMAEQSEKWAKIAEEKAAEWAKRSEEWAAKWEEGSAEREAKMQAWSKEFEPKMKEFELKMQEWQKANEPKMKEFELKMQEWQKAQEPKLKEFELKMKEWEATQKPKMEEFQKKMEVWQKEQQVKLREFQKLLQEELKKDNN
jgi:beta-lactamase regulating signal transducer with metallopeptidase domain